MSNPERKYQEQGLIQTALDRLAAIADRKHPPLSDNARWITQMLSAERFRIDVIDPELQLVQPWIMDFQVKEDPSHHIPDGVIVIDPYRMSASRTSTIDSELVRTISVAVQYPGRGFSRPLREVYGEAVEIQKAWLEACHSPATLLDPRMYDRHVLIKNIMGADAYYADFGLGDWKSALEKLRADRLLESSESANDEIQIIDELMKDPKEFILWRLRMSPNREQNRPMAQIQEAKFNSEPFTELAKKNALHAASVAIGESL